MMQTVLCFFPFFLPPAIIIISFVLSRIARTGLCANETPFLLHVWIYRSPSPFAVRPRSTWPIVYSDQVCWAKFGDFFLCLREKKEMQSGR